MRLAPGLSVGRGILPHKFMGSVVTYEQASITSIRGPAPLDSGTVFPRSYTNGWCREEQYIHPLC